MNEPRRLSEDDPYIGRMFDAARRDDAAEDSRARALALLSVGTTGVGLAIATGKSSSFAIAAGKATLIVLALAGGAALATRALRRPQVAPIVEAKATEQAPTSATPPIVEPIVPPIETAALVPSIAPLPVQKKITVPIASASAQPIVDDAAAELALVSAAHTALKAGDAKGALAKIAIWRKEHKGVFAEEAEAVHIDALVAAGARASAAERAAAFVSRWPKSPQAPRMRALATP